MVGGEEVVGEEVVGEGELEELMGEEDQHHHRRRLPGLRRRNSGRWTCSNHNRRTCV